MDHPYAELAANVFESAFPPVIEIGPGPFPVHPPAPQNDPWDHRERYQRCIDHLRGCKFSVDLLRFRQVVASKQPAESCIGLEEAPHLDAGFARQGRIAAEHDMGRRRGNGRTPVPRLTGPCLRPGLAGCCSTLRAPRPGSRWTLVKGTVARASTSPCPQLSM